MKQIFYLRNAPNTSYPNDQQIVYNGLVITSNHRLQTSFSTHNDNCYFREYQIRAPYSVKCTTIVNQQDGANSNENIIVAHELLHLFRIVLKMNKFLRKFHRIKTKLMTCVIRKLKSKFQNSTFQ